jgi:hypothetical protein
MDAGCASDWIWQWRWLGKLDAIWPKVHSSHKHHKVNARSSIASIGWEVAKEALRA